MGDYFCNKAFLTNTKHIVDMSSSYFIALEAWRRKLQVTFLKNTNNYLITSAKKSLFFCNSRCLYGSNGLVPFEICKNKSRAKEYFLKYNVNTPNGFLIQENKYDYISEYANKIGYPIVLKSNTEGGGLDIFPGISCDKRLYEILTHFKSKRIHEIVLEKHVSGIEYRVYVVGGKVIDAYTRVPANVVGDGISTIAELIVKKNEKRKSNPHLATRPIAIDLEVQWFIDEARHSLGSILGKDIVLQLRSKANLSAGGDVVDTTDNLPALVAELAVKAVNAIPYLYNGGVDIIFNEDNKEGYVLEINSMGQLGGHIFSSSTNKERSIPASIIDFYFPESIEFANQYNNIYYDQQFLKKYLLNDRENEYTLTPIPFNEYSSKLISLNNCQVEPQTINIVRDEFRRMNLIGNLKQHKVEGVFKLDIIAAGKIEILNYILNFIGKNIGIQNIDIALSDHHGGIIAGFFFQNDHSTKFLL